MDLKVLWANTASEQLEDVFDHCKITASLTTARKMVKGIVQKAASLSKQPKKGSVNYCLPTGKKSTGIL